MENTNNDNQFNTNSSTSVEPKPKKTSLECKVCSGPADHSNFGAISCDSCKIFFKRNAENKLKNFTCPYDNNCEINLFNRHICALCRLKKCFHVGMTSILFRGSNTKTQTKENSNNNQILQLPTINLLKLNQRLLSINEWNLLANIIHCYDERSTILIGERFVSEGNVLEIKLRFQVDNINEMVLSLMRQNQLCLQSNKDFLSLNLHNQVLLINLTLQHIISVGIAYTLGQSHLFDQQNLSKSVEILSQSNQFTYDDTFIKLIVSSIILSITNYLYKENSLPINLINLKQMINIQHIDVEFIWEYLTYKYGYNQAIKHFNNIIRIILISMDNIHQTRQIELYADVINSLIKQTEQAFHIVN